MTLIFIFGEMFGVLDKRIDVNIFHHMCLRTQDNFMSLRLRFVVVSLLLVFVQVCGVQANESGALQNRVAKLKNEVIQLNRDLFELEESILHPANTQVAVFFSVKTKQPFILDSIELKIDGRMATTYLYKEKELKALENRGVQRLYVGNISTGPHKINAVFNGQGSNDRYFRRDKTYSFEKSDRAKLIEISIDDSKSQNGPEISIKEWR